MLLLLNILDPQRLEVLEGRPQADRLGNGRCPSFKPIWWVSKSYLLFLDLPDHLSPALKRRHHREQLGLAKEDTDTSRTIDLVPRKDQKINVERLHINRSVGSQLGGINEDFGSGSMRLLNNLVDRRQRSRHV